MSCVVLEMIIRICYRTLDSGVESVTLWKIVKVQSDCSNSKWNEYKTLNSTAVIYFRFISVNVNAGLHIIALEIFSASPTRCYKATG